MSLEEQYDPPLDHGEDDRPGNGQANDLDETLLPTISLVYAPHEKIPNLFQYCYEYVEPWQWASGAERVETGRWFFGPAKDNL